MTNNDITIILTKIRKLNEAIQDNLSNHRIIQTAFQLGQIKELADRLSDGTYVLFEELLEKSSQESINE